MSPEQYQYFLIEVDSICELWNQDKLTDEEALVRIQEVYTRYHFGQGRIT